MRGPRDNALILVTLGAVVLVSRLMLLYRGGSPEPDSLAMVAGMTMALHGTTPLRETLLYGREGSPGMYLVGRFVYPLFFRDASHLLSFLNTLTALVSVAVVWPAYGIARRFFTRGVAAAAVAIALLAPAVWELSAYFHPVVPSTALLVFAIYAAIGADESPAGIARYAAAVLLGGAAFLCRVHVLFVLPALLLAALVGPRRRGRLIALAGALVAGLAAYAIFQTVASVPGRPAATGIAGYVAMVREMYLHSFSFRVLDRSAVWAASGMGIATLFALCAVPFYYRRHHARVGAGFAAAVIVWMVPSLLFWLPQPTPILRHYVLPTLGLALAVAAGLLARLRPRPLAVVVLLIVAGNIAIPEAAYRAYNTLHPNSPKTPNGTVFYFHERMNERIERYDGLSAAVNDSTRAGCAGALIFARWDAYAHLIYALARDHATLRPRATTGFFPSVQDRRYVTRDRQFEFVNYVYFEDPELKRRGIERIRSRLESGWAVFVPRELADGPLRGMLSGLAVAVY